MMTPVHISWDALSLNQTLCVISTLFLLFIESTANTDSRDGPERLNASSHLHTLWLLLTEPRGNALRIAFFTLCSLQGQQKGNISLCCWESLELILVREHRFLPRKMQI